LPTNKRIAIAALAAALLYFGLLAPYGLNIGEEGGTVHLFYRTLLGQRPYVDFITGYTPAYFYWHALVLRVFGPNLLALRGCLVLVNAATVPLLYLVARRVMPAHFAVLAALAYPALLPVVPAVSCSFNVPYPTWYGTVLWLLGVLVLMRWWRNGGDAWMLLAGLLAGVSFSFKPNTGVFNLMADALCITVACDPRRHAGHDSRAARLLWWAPLAALLGALILAFRAHLSGREPLLFVAPIVALVAVAACRPVVAEPGDPKRMLRRGLLRPLALLAAGFAGVSCPWLLYFLSQLGWSRFVHDVLLVHTSHAQFFYLPYRVVAGRDLGLAALLAVAVGGAYAVRWRWPSPRLAAPRLAGAVLAAAAVGSVAWVAFVAPMPEGFQRSVLLRLQDWSFGAALLTHWVMIGVVGSRRPERLGIQRTSDLFVVVASAPFMFLSVYPRSDFFHLICAAPLTLVCGAVLLSGVVRLWQAALADDGGRWVGAGAVAAACAVLLVVAAPQLQLCGQVLAHYSGGGDALVRVGLRRAPVLVRRDGAARQTQDLVPVVDYLERAHRPGDQLFTFPNLDLLCFLSGLLTPTRIGYFNAGWPDHVVEAEVVDTLALHPPRFMVVSNPAPLFFAEAPGYYFLLRDFVTSHYPVVGSVGSYVILHRAGAAAPVFVAPPAAGPNDRHASCGAAATLTRPAQLQRCLTAADHRAAAALIQRVRDAESAEAAAVLAEVWAGGKLARWPRSVTLLALRVITEVGDARAAEPLLAAAPPLGSDVQDAVATALFYIAAREMMAPFQFAGAAQATPAAAPVARIHEATLRRWLFTPGEDVRHRWFAAWALGRLAIVGDETADQRRALAAGLEQLTDESDGAVQFAAAVALAPLASSSDTFERLLRTLPFSPSLTPSVLLAWSREHPDAAAPVMARALQRREPSQREVLSFMAGVLGWPALMPSLQEAATAPQAQVRVAGVWALGRIGDPASVLTLRAAASDTDPTVRAFATVALRRLEG
jgi:hypothetical protein